jgi:hypothetical protein
VQRKLLMATVVILALIALGVPFGQVSFAAPSAASNTCASMDGRLFDTSNYSENFSVALNAGDTIGGTGITVKFPSDLIRDVFVQIDGVDYAQGFEPFGWSYTAPTTATYNILVEVHIGKGVFTAGRWTCTAVHSEPSAAPRPGPDMIAIPSGAVVGTFLADTPLYYAPDLSSVTTTTMKAGKTLWVFGVNADATFYQVVLSGQKLWVPVKVLGPTAAAPWNGWPLPTTVVQ